MGVVLINISIIHNICIFLTKLLCLKHSGSTFSIYNGRLGSKKMVEHPCRGVGIKIDRDICICLWVLNKHNAAVLLNSVTGSLYFQSILCRSKGKIAAAAKPDLICPKEKCLTVN